MFHEEGYASPLIKVVGLTKMASEATLDHLSSFWPSPSICVSSHGSPLGLLLSDPLGLLHWRPLGVLLSPCG